MGRYISGMGILIYRMPSLFSVKLYVCFAVLFVTLTSI